MYSINYFHGSGAYAILKEVYLDLQNLNIGTPNSDQTGSLCFNPYQARRYPAMATEMAAEIGQMKQKILVPEAFMSSSRITA